MPRRRGPYSSGRGTRRTDEQIRQLRRLRERQRATSRFHAGFRNRGSGGRFRAEPIPLIEKISVVAKKQAVDLQTATDYQLRELAGHELILKFFSPQSKNMIGAMLAAAGVIATEARELAPQPGHSWNRYSTGAYRESIRPVLNDGQVSVVAEGGAPSWVTGQSRNYASFVEFGGRTPKGIPTDPQPTLEPAYLQTRNEQLQAIVNYLKRAF